MRKTEIKNSAVQHVVFNFWNYSLRVSIKHVTVT